MLLHVHRHRLSPEDLEDCYSRATLELLAAARAGRAFASQEHIAHALDQRLRSRIGDRRRALSGRSPIEAALAGALPLGCGEAGETEAVDAMADVERLVYAREQLRRVRQAAAQLTNDQRIVLHSQLTGEIGMRELCRRHGWSAEKYRKVAQRARGRLRALLERPV
jgi:DNA-directed RNA polymerase specialized sigma24 family protein